jgi:uncharacterized protein (TIGR03437 family)
VKTILASAVLFLATTANVAQGQAVAPTILRIDVENFVQYVEDTSDLSMFATNQGITTINQPRNFHSNVTLADIVAVNGQPAKGTVAFDTRIVLLRPSPTAGAAIADTQRAGVRNSTFEILSSEGTPIGTIMATGLFAGVAPPGAPLDALVGNDAIVGGTGAFLGARGYAGQGAQTVPPRFASITEDPGNRRRNGGGKTRFVLHVIPLARPEILTTSSGPTIFHSDFSPVNRAQPARAGEVLIMVATGLGPTRPGVDPGKPFPADPLPQLNSPLEVTVNGRPAEILLSIGRPGTTDRYRVDFRVPEATTAGLGAVQLSTAWIAGPEAAIAIQ